LLKLAAEERADRIGAQANALIGHGSGLDVEAIAAEVGYSDGHTPRMFLRERLGRGVRDLRADLR